jgi:hypothetical protein
MIIDDAENFDYQESIRWNSVSAEKFADKVTYCYNGLNVVQKLCANIYISDNGRLNSWIYKY